MINTFAEYIWVDNTEPTKLLRSKTRIVQLAEEVSISDFPEWGFDGSSTNQATGDNSDCLLRPVSFVPDPIRGDHSFLVMCEVYLKNGKPHPSNTRALLRNVLAAGADKQDAYFGFEQEYTLFDENNRPLGWPAKGFPAAQGPYYCGAGSKRVAGRDLVETHQLACVEAGLLIYGINAEVMLAQWEFQIGYRGFDEHCDVLTTVDHLRFATWLMYRLSEEFGIQVSFENKPMKGDWNGAGCHVNFSTKDMRDKHTGKATIERTIKNFEKNHKAHIDVYGHLLADRLTGLHETCSIDEFRAGESDRGASIRIPVSTAAKGYGYLEDRRPGANIDPYLVAARILVTTCDLQDSLLSIENLAVK